MNKCQDSHEIKYQITYKHAKGGKHTTIWLVCEVCMGKRHFGTDREIQNIKILA